MPITLEPETFKSWAHLALIALIAGVLVGALGPTIQSAISPITSKL